MKMSIVWKNGWERLTETPNLISAHINSLLESQVHLSNCMLMQLLNWKPYTHIYHPFAVKKQLDADVSLGVVEKVPHGQPSVWCHRMVVTRKADGTPRRTVDISMINKSCLCETHHVKPHFHQAKSPRIHGKPSQMLGMGFTRFRCWRMTDTNTMLHPMVH